jgi:hypothetical protein
MTLLAFSPLIDSCIILKKDSWLFVIHNEKPFILRPGKRFSFCKKDPHKFEEVVEAYLFETLFVDKIKLQTESGEKEISKKFS